MLDCYPDDPKSIGAAVQRACVKRGLFDGHKVQRSDLLWVAQQEHKRANGGTTNPEHETLGRELRHRNETMGKVICPTCDGEGEFDSCGPSDDTDVEMRHCDRCNGTGKVSKARQRMHFYDRALAQGWRIVCEKGRVWAERV